ncbi:hypothetical protein F4821DRAFT_261574 [Hypoxylon rubiginosum]|uniref:Uncharacterized protein n=1 Tax=Hypoxylon rubiginosum TaxID=110542 RepID=A0ACC0CWP2_9PEZI|nr:hypothetical protein F4821DRAFT_261574 [Hypoxylon rubiginosum]
MVPSLRSEKHVIGILNNLKMVLDAFLSRNKDIRKMEERMRDMKLDDALLVLNVANWEIEHIGFFIGYLTARARQAKAKLSRLQHTMLAASVIEDCTFMSDPNANAKIPVIMFVYAISRVTVAMAEGVNLMDYVLNKYKIPNPKSTSAAQDDATAQFWGEEPVHSADEEPDRSWGI